MMRRTPQDLTVEALENRLMLSTVEILATGETGEEKMSLEIDGQYIDTWLVNRSNESTFDSYLYETSEILSADQVRISFLNDKAIYDDNGDTIFDRNLKVDAIIIDGERFETEDPSVFSVGSWTIDTGLDPGYKQSEYLNGNGYFQYAEIAPEGSLVTVTAAGLDGSETMVLQVSGQDVLTVENIGTEFQDFTFQAEETVFADDIKVFFTNDFYDGQTNRDLIVDRLQIDDVVYETEDASVYSTGHWQSAGLVSGFWQTQTLAANGYFHYGQNQELATELVVQAKGSTGEEIMRLFVDDEIVAQWNDIGTTFDAYTVLVNDEVNADDVRVQFLNDLYDEETGLDRNLDVDFISISGAKYQTEHPEVYSTGTWKAEDGVTPGFRESETLHSYGYFQYADIELPAGSFGLNTSFAVTTEAASVVTMTVNRIGGTSGEVTVDYKTVDLTAVAGEDYTAVEGVLVFADGVASLDVDITILADELDEDGERLSFVIENPQGGAGLLSPRTATIEISDEFTPGQNGPGDPELDWQTEILFDLGGATGAEWSPDGNLMFISEFGGSVRVAENGVLLATPFIDLSDEVNLVRGMLDLAVHPDFENNPYIYVAYAFDPPETAALTGLGAADGAGNRASRIVRITADAANDYKTAVAGSEVVLVGGNSVWEYYNGLVDSTVDLDEPAGGVLPDGTNVQDFIAVDSQSHSVNALAFGPDGALYIATGDSSSYNSVDPRAMRAMDIDNLSGKILRIDAITGEGLADNPHFDGDPNSNRSKVYQSGFRNPFRISFDSTGQIYVGDVGWTSWEEINAGAPGATFGWPFYEGGDGENLPTIGYENLPEAIEYYADNPNVTAPILGLNHVDSEIDALILGDFYSGDQLPSQYQGMLIFSHLATGFVRGVEFNELGQVTAIRTLLEGPAFMTQTMTGPDGHLYFVDFGTGQIGRWVDG